MCSISSPFWNSRTVPDDWLTATATALVRRLMAAAAQWRAPSPLLNVMPSARASMYMHAATATHFYFDPLDRAVEKLWFNGVTVVAAAGNYGVATGPSGVRYSPGNHSNRMVVDDSAMAAGIAFHAAAALRFLGGPGKG